VQLRVGFCGLFRGEFSFRQERQKLGSLELR
jgi:hypothetical protein